MSRIAAVAVVLAALIVAVPGAGAAKRTTCKSGSTLYKKQGVRIFETLRVEQGVQITRVFACRPKSSTPSRLYTSSGTTTTEFKKAEREGTQIVFWIDDFADEGGSSVVGTFATRTGRVRVAYLDQEDYGRPEGLSVAADGRVAISTGTPVYGVSENPPDGSEAISVLAPATKAGVLRQPKRVAVVEGGIKPETLRIDASTVTWTTAAGQPGSAPRP